MIELILAIVGGIATGVVTGIVIYLLINIVQVKKAIKNARALMKLHQAVQSSARPPIPLFKKVDNN